MHITSILSFLGAWISLQRDYPVEYQQIQDAIEKTSTFFVTDPSYNPNRKPYRPGSSFFSPDKIFKDKFENYEWKVNDRLYFQGVKQKRYSELDALKNGMGIEYGFRSHTSIESNVFVKIPLFIKAHRIKIGAILVLADDFTKGTSFGMTHFGKVRDRIVGSSPLIKYPFVIIGISDKSSEIMIEEMTSELDQYLIQKAGFTLFELVAQAENKNYDFKQLLPENKKIAQEACAFANTVGGGLMLVGVDDKGVPRGISRDEIDGMQLRIYQVVTDNCKPPPIVECIPFEAPDRPEKKIVVVRIAEIERKPCMYDGKVYIRAGASARPANSDEIRRIVLASGV